MNPHYETTLEYMLGFVAACTRDYFPPDHFMTEDAYRTYLTVEYQEQKIRLAIRRGECDAADYSKHHEAYLRSKQ